MVSETVVPRARVEPYYDDGQCSIYHGDCRELIPEVGPFDLVFTSPPYNLGGSPWPHLGHWKPGDGTSGSKSKWRNGSDGSGGVTYEDHEDTQPWPECVAWQQDVLWDLWQAIDDDGAIFYNHKPRVIGGRLWTPQELTERLPVRQIIVWARAGGMNYNPTAYVPTYEWIMVLARPAWRLASKGASGVGDVWRVPQEANPDHPAPFPVGLPGRAIDTAAPRRVLDPFMGSGSTLVAAKAAGVPAVGIEVSERYCEVAARRLAQGSLFGGDPVKEETDE